MNASYRKYGDNMDVQTKEEGLGSLGERLGIDQRRLELDILKNSQEHQFRNDQLGEQRIARQLDCELKAKELELRRQEVETSQGSILKVSPQLALVFGALLSAISAIVGAAIQFEATIEAEGTKSKSAIEVERERSNAQQVLERQKFEANLILKSTESPSRDERIRNLKFFINAGYIKDGSDRILKMADTEYPYLPKPHEVFAQPEQTCDRPAWVQAFWTVKGKKNFISSVLPLDDKSIKELEGEYGAEYTDFLRKISSFSNAWYAARKMPPAKILAGFDDEFPQPAEVTILTACWVDGRNFEIKRVNNAGESGVVRLPIASNPEK